MILGLTISDLSALMVALFTCGAAISGVLLWFTTRRTVQLLLQQVNHQIASSHSVAQHQVINAHRDLFLGIANNPALCDAFIQINNLDKDTWVRQKIAAFLINNVMVYHTNLVNGTISHRYWEGFKRDSKEMFALPAIRHHWADVQAIHPREFREFVERELLGEHHS